MAKLRLLLEGQRDKEIVFAALKAANLDLLDIEIKVMNGKDDIINFVKAMHDGEVPTVALIGTDYKTLGDAIAEWGSFKRQTLLSICFAMPEIEAWLFADDRMVMASAETSEARAIASRLPLPEQVPDPKALVPKVFKNFPAAVDCLARSDISYAAARSPTLKAFLTEVASKLGVDLDLAISEAYSTNFNRDILANLIYEVAPSDMIVFREASGQTHTAEEMIRNIREGTELGRQYATDLLRVSRDWLARYARRA